MSSDGGYLLDNAQVRAGARFRALAELLDGRADRVRLVDGGVASADDVGREPAQRRPAQARPSWRARSAAS